MLTPIYYSVRWADPLSPGLTVLWLPPRLTRATVVSLAFLVYISRNKQLEPVSRRQITHNASMVVLLLLA